MKTVRSGSSAIRPPAHPLSVSVFVVVPTYNEVENIPALTQALFHLPLPDLNLVIVDDNSPDGTGEVAEQLKPRYPGRVHVIHRPGKNGLGTAYLEGFRYALAAGADFIVQMDADFSHSPAELPNMLRRIFSSDVVVGSRYIDQGRLDPHWNAGRYWLSWWANSVYVRLILGIHVQDATAGFKCWTRSALQAVLAQPISSQGYVFQVEMAYVAEKLGLRVVETPIFFQERQQGASKMSVRIKLEAALRTWQVRWHYRALRKLPAGTIRSAEKTLPHARHTPTPLPFGN